MQLTRFHTAADLRARAEGFLMAHEAAHNLLLGITSNLINNPGLFEAPPYLAVVERAGRVIAAALRTPPHNLVLSLTDSHEALEMIAHDAQAFYGSLPAVAGPKPLSQQFAETWRTLTRQSYSLKLALRIYQLRQVTPPANVTGHFRHATPEDKALLADWLIAFGLESLGEDMAREEADRRVENYFVSPSRGAAVWEDGDVVSMAVFTGPTPNGIRISGVYTPPEFRSRGYASACVAALSQWLLDGGRKFCFLFTDLSNPTSNKIYQQIGYEPVCDVDEYVFGPAQKP